MQRTYLLCGTHGPCSCGIILYAFLSPLSRRLLRWATLSWRKSAPLSREVHVRTPSSPSWWRASLPSAPPSRTAARGSVAPLWASTWRSCARWETRARERTPKRSTLAKWWRCPRPVRPSWVRAPSTSKSVSSWVMLTAKLSSPSEAMCSAACKRFVRHPIPRNRKSLFRLESHCCLFSWNQCNQRINTVFIWRPELVSFVRFTSIGAAPLFTSGQNGLGLANDQVDTKSSQCRI